MSERHDVETVGALDVQWWAPDLYATSDGRYLTAREVDDLRQAAAAPPVEPAHTRPAVTWADRWPNLAATAEGMAWARLVVGKP